MVENIVQQAEKMDEELRQARSLWLEPWQEVTQFVRQFGQHFVPRTSSVGSYTNAYTGGPQSPNRGKHIYNSTPVWAIDRLTAGVIGLTMPRGEKWHTLGFEDPFSPESTDEEIEWFESVRDHLFAIRYNPRANFARATYMAIKTMNELGTGLVMVDEVLEGGATNPTFYRHMPLSETAIGLDDDGNLNRCTRRFVRSAHQVVQRFGNLCSEQVKTWASDPSTAEKEVELLHAIAPRPSANLGRLGVMGSEFMSVYIESETRHLISESGFIEFPIIPFYWYRDEGSPYGESPAMAALADIKSLNAGSKTRMQSASQWVNPPLGIPSKGIGNRLNLNAGKINPGAVDERGNLRVQPIITSPNPGFADSIIQSASEGVNRALYIDLFQALIDAPALTATQSTMISAEKNELLSPLGTMLETGLSLMVEREVGILQRRGAFELDSPLALPESLEGRNIGVVYTSPLTRLRRQSELLGIDRTLDMNERLAQVDPSVLDNIDVDETIRMTQEITGAPKKMLKRTDERDEQRETRAAAAAEQAQIEQAQQTADLVNTAAPALEQLNGMADTAPQ